MRNGIVKCFPLQLEESQNIFTVELTLPYRCGVPLTTLPLMDLHCSRFLVISRSCWVVTPPPTYSFIRSKYFIRGLPLLRLPAILPVIARFSRPSALIAWPRNAICLFRIVANSSLLPPIVSRTLSLLLLSVQLTLNILLQHHISIASSRRSISLLTVQASHP